MKNLRRITLSLTAVAIVSMSFVSVVWAQQPTVGIKNFRSYLASLETVTGVKASKVPSIIKFYSDNVTGLPKNGVVTELNGPTLMKYAGLAGLFCQEYAKQLESSNTAPIELDATKPGGVVKNVSLEKRTALINSYAGLFLDRAATPLEVQNNLAFAQALGDSSNMKMAIGFCTSFGASIEFIAE